MSQLHQLESVKVKFNFGNEISIIKWVRRVEKDGQARMSIYTGEGAVLSYIYSTTTCYCEMYKRIHSSLPLY